MENEQDRKCASVIRSGEAASKQVGKTTLAKRRSVIIKRGTSLAVITFGYCYSNLCKRGVPDKKLSERKITVNEKKRGTFKGKDDRSW